MVEICETWERLLKNSCRDDSTNCLNWTSFCKGGYGRTTYHRTHLAAHRLSYMIWKHDYKTIPLRNESGVRMIVRHMCNNSLCIEPSHLKLGTQYENDYDDKILHGTIQRGTRHYNCSINEKIAKKIKWSLFNKGHPLYKTKEQRSQIFDVTVTTIRCIDQGRSWSHIPDRDGNTSSHRKEKARISRKVARDRVWTRKDFSNAMSKIIKFSEEYDGGYKDKCWKWLKGVNSEGYGRITVNGKCGRVHIVACESKNYRHRKEDEVTRHLCSNKICCNPNHLDFGSPYQNNMDTLLDGSNKRLKLDKSKVKIIRESNETLQNLSRRYGVTVTTIDRVRKRKIWNI